MKNTRQVGQELFNQHFQHIEEAIRGVAAQQRLSTDESKELYSLVMLKIVQGEYAVLRDFKGNSRWKTYLEVVVRRVLLDERVKQWGRWRPSAAARRLGPVAMELDRRINRDGKEPPEAIRELLAGETTSLTELERLAARVPRRPRRRLVRGQIHLRTLVGHETADRRVVASESRRNATTLQIILSKALLALPHRDRVLLSMRFHRGWSVRRIATSQNVPERHLYRHFHRTLRHLRRHLERGGLDWGIIAAALDSRDVDLDIDLR